MNFSSSIFIFAFLPLVILIYYGFLHKRSLRNIFLLVVSLFFYAWGEPCFVFIMLLSIIANYYFAIIADRFRENKRAAKNTIFLMVLFNLLILFLFKYLIFTVTNVNLVLGTSLILPVIGLPVGVSFFTFQAMSYVLDVYRGRTPVQKSLLHVALYISFFPQLIMGPIVRYETIAEQMVGRKENLDDFSKGLCRFIRGLAKKILLANTLGLVADAAYAAAASSPDTFSVSYAWLGALAYTFQIFYDFAGYSDMALGLGRMFGFHFLENFDYPYISKSASEFWRRWHISLGSWFRDYIFIPLGGSRVSKVRLLFNLFVVWSLTGLWHGANWTFICWGLLYFILLTLEKFTGFDQKIPKQFQFINHIYALLAIIIGWVFFRSPDIGSAFAYLQVMFGLSGNVLFDDISALYISENIYFFIFAIIFSTPIVPFINKQIDKRPGIKKLFSFIYPFAYWGLLVICISYIVKGSYNPFIYFNF